jgi:autotransporter-associated beta strand protein
MADGTTLRAAADNLTLANNFLFNGAATVDTQAFALTLGGLLSGDGPLTKTGSGGVTLTRDNTYLGGTLIQQGVIGVGRNTALGSGAATMSGGTTLRAAADNLTLANAFTLNGAATVDTQAFALTLGGLLSGDGPLTKTGTGGLTLTRDNTYLGGTLLQQGAIGVGRNTALGTGAVTMEGGTTLRAAAADLTLANAFTLNGAATVDTQAFALTLGGVLGGTGSLTKTSSGVLTLTGDNSYSGDTTVSGGVLQIGGAGRLGQGDYAGAIALSGG